MAGKNHLRPGEYYGHSEKWDAGGALLCHLQHDSARRIPEHTHQRAYFCLLLEGDYKECFAGHEIWYRPFTLVFHPPAMTHHDEIGPRGGRFFTIEIPEERLSDLRSYSHRLDTRPDLRGGPAVWRAIELYREYRARQAPFNVDCLVTELLAEAACVPAAREGIAPRWMQRVTDRLQACFLSPPALSELASDAGVHPVHLTRTFRRVHQTTPGGYVQRLRVQYACRRLAEPESRLVDIAADAGFADQSHFTRIFQRITGVTPGAMRQELLA